MSARRLALLVAALATFAARPSRAHQSAQSFCTVTTVPGGLDVEVETPVDLLALPFGLSSVEPSAAELAAHYADFQAAVRRDVKAETPNGACRLELDAPRILERDVRSLSLVGHFYCPDGAVTLTNRWRLGFDPASETVCALDGEGFVFRRGTETRSVGVPKSVASTLRAFLALGVEHVLGGIDHMLFVLLLLVQAASPHERRAERRFARLRRVAGLVTSFTVGHSITLLAAGLGLIEVSARWVESLIALSIVVLGLENALRNRVQGRALWVVAFGMIHGFGFASVLAQTALPRRAAVASLLMFNVGIELAQLGLVCLAFPLLALAATSAHYRQRLLIPLSLAVAFVATLWFVKRATGADFLPWLGA